MTQNSKKRTFAPYAVGIVLLALILLLVRENEGRTAAETKLRNAEQSIDELRSEKSSLANELEAQVAELQEKLQDAASRHEMLVSEKKTEAQRHEAELGDAVARHEAEIRRKDAEMAEIETAAKTNAKKLGDLLAEKKAEVADLGAHLKETSLKYATLLKKKEALESRALACEERVGSLEKSLKKAERLSTELSDTVQKGQLQKTAVD